MNEQERKELAASLSDASPVELAEYLSTFLVFTGTPDEDRLDVAIQTVYAPDGTCRICGRTQGDHETVVEQGETLPCVVGQLSAFLEIVL